MGWFERIFRSHAKAVQDAETAKASFRTRFNDFHAILQANNHALEIMSELEEALRGERLFGMAFVRSGCAAVLEDAEAMIGGLSRLAPGSYGRLGERLEIIRSEVVPRLTLGGAGASGPLVMPLHDAGRESADLVGGKMANLAEMAKALHVAVPEGFVVTSAGFRRFLEHNELPERILKRLDNLVRTQDSKTYGANTTGPRSAYSMEQLHRLSFELQEMVLEGEVPPDLAEAMADAWDSLRQRFGPDLRLAMRSSAVGEDFAGISFAGQYRTELNVDRERMLTAYREVLASKYALTAMSYRLARGIPDEETPMCVGCLRMVEAARSGVMYTRSPLPRGTGELLISAVFGLPKGIVDGSAPSDLYVVAREGPVRLLRSDLAVKSSKYATLAAGGVGLEKTPEDERTKPVLGPEQAVALAELGLMVEAFYDRPMDVEWAYDAQGSLVLLQCRPLSIPEAAAQEVLVREAALQETTTHEAGGRPLLAGGITASQGAAAGPVHLALKEADMLSFPAGGVLVATQSSPRLAPLLSRAAAVVCEQGSLTGHLANVSREFGVPALFGVGGATRILEPGAEVTVDADAKVVLAGRVESLLEGRAQPRNLMEGSTVLETLRSVSRSILPLTLLDPDSPTFRAANCSTVHDIARFCHEKSVKEMFRFSKRHAGPKRAGKRLVTSSPMQWWVLDLDDGLGGEDRGRYVHLDDVVSIPMRAVWDGITAIPWQGPPSMDGRGFVSVLFRSTMDRSLDPAAPSRYSQRNYFMISRNYCSLHSRFGYHFAQVEGFVGEVPRENFASFRFQGGAADDLRRQRRVDLVAGLLEERGFRVTVREDKLVARLERLDRGAMEGGLRMLGYLLMHTRQLDMVMNNPEQVRAIRTRLREGLERVAALRPLPSGAPR